MRTINQLHLSLWHINTSIVVLIWEFIITINCLFFVSGNKQMMWYVLTAITLIVWIIAILIHYYFDDVRVDAIIKKREHDDEESGRRW